MSLVGLLDYFDRKAGREEYGNLVKEYWQPGNPAQENPGPWALGQPEMTQAQLGQAGGWKGGGGLLANGPPQDFYLRAGALPGYQQLAAQAQTGQQAMERQMQGQQWSQTNMPLAEKTRLDMQAQQHKWEQERREYEYGNMSAAQKASNAIAQGHLGLAASGQRFSQDMARNEFNARYVPAEGGGFLPRPTQQAAPSGYQWTPQGTLAAIPGGPAAVANEQTTRVLQGSVNQLADIQSQVRNDGTKGIQTLQGNVKATQQAFENAARPIISKAVMGTRTDAPNQTDLEAINGQLMSVVSMFGRDATRDKAIGMLMEMASQQNGSPLRAERGVSPYFKTYRSDTGRSKLPADVKPFNPPGAP